MPTYRVEVPSEGTLRVESPEELTNDQVLAVVAQELEPRSRLPQVAERFFREHPGAAMPAALAARIIPPIALGAVGAPAGPPGLVAGGGAGALAGGALAQEIEKAAGLREEISPGVLTADVALGLVPGVRIARGLGKAAQIGRTFERGGQYGLASRVIEKAIDEGELPTLPEVAESFALGGAAGLGLEAGARAVRGTARGIRRLRRTPAEAAVDEAIGATEIVGPPEPPVKLHEHRRLIRPGPQAPEGEVTILDASGRPLGEQTPAGFVVPADTPAITTKPMPAERIPELADRLGGTAAVKAERRARLEAIAPELETQTRGVVPDAEIERMGHALRMARGLKPGQALNPEETASVYAALKASEARVDSVRESLRATPDDPNVLATWNEALDENLRLIRLLAGPRSEWGRTGRAHRLGQEALKEVGREGPAGVGADFGQRKLRLARELRRAQRKGLLRGGETADDVLKRVVANIDDPVSAVRIVRDATRVPLLGKETLTNFVYSNYLSRPKTQIRNIIGNTGELVSLTAGRGAAAAMGEPSVQLGELGAPLATGFRTGFASGVRKSFEIMRDGVMREDLQDPDFIFRFLSAESPTELAAGLRGIALPGDPWSRRLAVGAARVVPRALWSVDIFFRSIAEEVAKHQGAFARAHEQALAEGAKNLKGRRLDIAAGLLANVPEELRQEATLAGRRAVYQETPGFLAKSLMEFGKKNTGTRVLQLLFQPFVRTPANILRRGVALQVPGVSSIAVPRELRRQLKAEGITEGTVAADRIRAQLAGNMALGYLAVVPLAYLAANARLVGPMPEGAAERARFFEQGWQPNSLVIGNRSIPLATFGAAGVTAQMVANAVEQFRRDGDEAGFYDRIWNATGSAAASIRDISFMTGIREIFDTGIGDFSPKTFSRTVGRKLSGLVIPGVVQDIEQIVDPTIRIPGAQVKGLRASFEEFLSRAPGFSEAVQPRLGTFGEIREPLEETAGQQVFSVLTGTRMIAPDPVRHELDRLQSSVGKAGKPVGVSPPGQRYTFDQEPLDDPNSLFAYRQAIGQARGRAIVWVMSQPQYSSPTVSDQQRAYELNRRTAEADRWVRKRTLPLVRAQRAGRRGSFTVEEIFGGP